MRRFLPFIIIGVVMLIAAGGGLLLYQSKHSSVPIKIAEGKPGAEPSHVRGGENARITLEEFGDYQCAPCGILAATLLKVEHQYGSRVRVVFRQFPLNMHQFAMTAACAAEAAGLQGRFWEMHDLLYETAATTWGKPQARPFRRSNPGADAALTEMENSTRATFIEYATRIGLDVERFKADMDSEQVKKRILEDQERGFSLGVDRTPVVFIDGIQVPFSSLKPENLPGVIEDAINGKAPAPESPTPAPTSTP